MRVKEKIALSDSSVHQSDPEFLFVETLLRESSYRWCLLDNVSLAQTGKLNENLNNFLGQKIRWYSLDLLSHSEEVFSIQHSNGEWVVIDALHETDGLWLFTEKRFELERFLPKEEFGLGPILN